MAQLDTTHIRRAVLAAKSQASLARALGVSPQAVNQWVRGKRPVPAGYSISIEKFVNGKVSRYDLHPDVFGNPPQDKTQDKAAA